MKCLESDVSTNVTISEDLGCKMPQEMCAKGSLHKSLVQKSLCL